MPNYQKLGFKCGIEIHQQLNTNKLFCKCPSEIRKDNPDFIINRSLRVSAGETGKVDILDIIRMSRDFVEETLILNNFDFHINNSRYKLITTILLFQIL